MASTSVSRVLPASPQQVWDLIGGFDALPDWLPFIRESTPLEGGRVRRLTNPDGDVITERLIAYSEAERSYSYAIVDAPFPSPVTSPRSASTRSPAGTTSPRCSGPAASRPTE